MNKCDNVLLEYSWLSSLSHPMLESVCTAAGCDYISVCLLVLRAIDAPNRQWCFWSNYIHAQANMNWVHIFKDRFSCIAIHIYFSTHCHFCFVVVVLSFVLSDRQCKKLSKKISLVIIELLLLTWSSLIYPTFSDTSEFFEKFCSIYFPGCLQNADTSFCKQSGTTIFKQAEDLIKHSWKIHQRTNIVFKYFKLLKYFTFSATGTFLYQ